MYAAAVGRWNGVDALGEEYLSSSPFVYVLNNPIILFDPNGLEVINGHQRELVEANERISEAEANLASLESSAVEKGSEGYKEYRQNVKDAQRELRDARSSLATTQANFDVVEAALNAYAYFDPEGYAQLDNLTNPTTGDVIDVVVTVGANLSFDGENLGGHTGLSVVEGTIFTRPDGSTDHYTINNNQVGMRITRLPGGGQTTGKTVAHEKGHITYEVGNLDTYRDWIRANPQNYQSGGHGKGDPSGDAANKAQAVYENNMRSMSPMPANYKRN